MSLVRKLYSTVEELKEVQWGENAKIPSHGGGVNPQNDFGNAGKGRHGKGRKGGKAPETINILFSHPGHS